MKKSNHFGYTFIELVVVIALLMGLTTVVLLNSSESRNVTKLNNAVRELEGALLEAQALGNSGRAFPPGDSSDVAFDKGYGVFVDKNASSVIIYGGQGPGGDAFIDPSEEMYISGQDYETVHFTGEAIISNIEPSTGTNASEAHILYRRGTMEAHLHSVSPNQFNLNMLTITLERNGVEKDVVVTKTGLIYVDD